MTSLLRTRPTAGGPLAPTSLRSSQWAPAWSAQVLAETTLRLRSTGTLVAVVALFIASYAWLPAPASNATSIAWEGPAGERMSSVYNAAYVGAAGGGLAALFLSLIGFYLVAGSVRRDRDAGVGVILAATPLTRRAYLFGKLAANAAYLHVVGGVAVLAAGLVFVLHGTGPLDLVAFLAPFLLFASPALVFTAAVALLFDTAPGLRGRGGLVAYFFVWGVVVMALPLQLHGGLERRKQWEGVPVFDPAGAVTFRQEVENSMPAERPHAVSMGLQFSNEPVTRVHWAGIRWTTELVGARLASYLWALVPMAGAVLGFDRFDPARSRRRTRVQAGPVRSAPEAAAANAGARLALGPAVRAPTFARAVPAEVRLLWASAPRLRGALLAAALAGAVPDSTGRAATAAFLLLLAPVLADAAARERIHGTDTLIRAHAGVPASLTTWKLSASALFALALGLPSLLSALASSPARAFALATGLLFVAAFATSAAVLTGGGKLFSGAYTALWYMAASGPPGLDYCGAFGGGLSAGSRLSWLVAELVLVSAAALVERRRAATA